MDRAVFLDRDGTIIEDRGFITEKKDIVFFHGVFAALRELQKYFKLFIVTNQCGVGLGHLSQDSVKFIHDQMLWSLYNEGVLIEQTYTCFHVREDKCKCMKPSPYFLQEAARNYDLSLPDSFLVGDHPHDIECAENAGAIGLYVMTGHGSKHMSQLSSKVKVFPDLSIAAKWIHKHHTCRNGRTK